MEIRCASSAACTCIHMATAACNIRSSSRNGMELRLRGFETITAPDHCLIAQVGTIHKWTHMACDQFANPSGHVSLQTRALHPGASIYSAVIWLY